ncbi:uncharacterized protein LOC110989678 isoform X2 [Acanthaster planci]|uniref:Uncharacterized protein LOC110989678 isoform X2 n=1 Tax=Acanthaster planci TaxID=133434 RepID=A0A8B7ZYV7_ACAPL|nr:uncharacterized protein LOC110989678 isoform X2 [Acanthaster planci]
MGSSLSGHKRPAQRRSKREFPSRHWVPYPLGPPRGRGDQSGRVVKAVDLTSVLQPCGNFSHVPVVSWWVDCEFLPYDDSRLLTCIALHDLGGQGLPPNLPPCTTNGVINVWNLGKQNSGCTTEIHRKSSLPHPHCQMAPDGSFVCYLESGGVIMRSINNVQQVYKREAFFRYGIYHYCTVSPDDKYLATITRQRHCFQLYVFSIQHFYSYKEANCQDIFPEFQWDRHSRANNEQVECRFSPDSQMIAVSSSSGQLFVARRSGLTLYRAALPGVCGQQASLAKPRTFDFDPRFGHEVLAACWSDQMLVVCNLERGTLAWKSHLPISLGSPDCLKYNPEGTTLAVAGSQAKIGLFHSSNGEALVLLDGADQCVHFSMKQQPASGCYPTVLRLSFTYNASHLAAASTDGFVRIWCLPRISSLQSLCRLKILKHVPLDTVGKLPLPKKLTDYVLCNPMWS